MNKPIGRHFPSGLSLLLSALRDPEVTRPRAKRQALLELSPNVEPLRRKYDICLEGGYVSSAARIGFP
jgi:hypothetical protein